MAYPTNLKQLRGFLGLSGYYRRFIHNYASIVGPLTALFKKDASHWNDQAAVAFTSLKAAITSAPMFALPNCNRPFIIEADASSSGIGVVLSQDKHRSYCFFFS